MNHIAISKIPDGCRRVGARLLPVKTPWDWVLTFQGKTALVDTKTTQNDVFNHSMITEHQVLELAQHERNGAIAGYVIWLRENNRVIFIAATELVTLMYSRGSISDVHPKARSLGGKEFDPKLIFRVGEV